MPYFLDGNNLIGLARGTGRPSEADREALVQEITQRLRRTKARIVLFFDGRGHRNATLGPLVIRAAGTVPADDAIIAEVERARTPREIVVVTADRELSARAKDLGAQTLAPHEFWARVGSEAPREKQGTDRPVDVEEWLRYFEDERNRT